jgi:predicted transposase/invertase (TIGR01784 family)
VNKTFFADAALVHQFECYDTERGVSLGGRSRIITLEFSKLGGIVEKPVEEMNAQEKWAVFFRYLTDKEKRQKINEILKYEEGIEMAGEVLITISRDEAERARLTSEYKYVADTQSKVVQARRQGIRQGIIETAKAAKKASISADLIASITGLSLDEIAKL